ncbi:GNAT family N-acetyltransferase [Lichenihabitans psoromatis]|uniref:GNAT family N-acetyltransferase n=1 Tax=Lichenihabitans psoromatis TaxID=2528642 RepID=UPI0010383A61|nr:GNAT family N-acetyltransferase [Lichenihabitans psoromatis]
MALFGRATRPIVTPLNVGHAADCADLHGASFPHGWSSFDFERLIAASSSFGDVAYDGQSGKLLGFVLSRGAAGDAEILTIAVAATARRRGIGRALLERHLGHLGSAGIAVLFLEVAENNRAARALYTAFGFTEVGRRPSYYTAKPGEVAGAALVLRRSIG